MSTQSRVIMNTCLQGLGSQSYCILGQTVYRCVPGCWQNHHWHPQGCIVRVLHLLHKHLEQAQWLPPPWDRAQGPEPQPDEGTHWLHVHQGNGGQSSGMSSFSFSAMFALWLLFSVSDQITRLGYFSNVLGIKVANLLDYFEKQHF